MEPQAEMMDLVKRTVYDLCGMDVRLDGAQEEGGISAELTAGYQDGVYYSKGAIRVLPVLFMCKDRDQLRCLNRLCRICNVLQALKQYPGADSFCWLDATTATEPNKVGRQEDGQWIYSAVINCKIYY